MTDNAPPFPHHFPHQSADRLRQAGFQVADIDYAATFTEAERRLYALPADHMYVVYKV